MSEPPSRSGTGWFIAGGALFIGYLIGHGSGASPLNTYAQPNAPAAAVATPTASTDADTIDPAVLTAAESAADATSDDATDESAPDMDSAPAYVADATEDQQGDDADQEIASAPATDTAESSDVALASDDPPISYQSTTAAPTIAAPVTGYSPPAVAYSGSSTKCESLGCYGVISKVTGLPRTTYVSGYTRKDGTYVRPYYRSHRSH